MWPSQGLDSFAVKGFLGSHGRALILGGVGLVSWEQDVPSGPLFHGMGNDGVEQLLLLLETHQVVPAPGLQLLAVVFPSVQSLGAQGPGH